MTEAIGMGKRAANEIDRLLDILLPPPRPIAPDEEPSAARDAQQAAKINLRVRLEAAEALGLGRLGILFRHILRNVISPIVIQTLSSHGLAADDLIHRDARSWRRH